METMEMLDQIRTAIERVVKSADSPRTKRMGLDAFVTHALTELRKAAGEEPRVAARRLSLLKRSVDGAIATLAKLNPEDTESETVEVEVLTAWAPSEEDGDEPEEELTTASEQSEDEIAPASISPAVGDAAFATNLDEVAKVLQKIKEDLDEKPGQDRRKTERAAAKKADGSASDAWPLDLNTETFRTGVEKAESPPAWGYDPAVQKP